MPRMGYKEERREEGSLSLDAAGLQIKNFLSGEHSHVPAFVYTIKPEIKRSMSLDIPRFHNPDELKEVLYLA